VLLAAWTSSSAAVEAQALVGASIMKVGAGVNVPCILLTTDLTFPNYDPGTQSAADLYGLGFVSVGCSTSTVQVTIGEGLNPDWDSTPATPKRRMALAGNYLGYDLCVDPACATVWSDTPAGVPVDGPFPKNVPVYGRIYMNQSPPTGTYTDTVVITVSF
jgi:spore coat protein U-like protein